MIKFSSITVAKLRKKVFFKLLKLSKKIYQTVRFRGSYSKTLLFVVGCQRSGTSLIMEIFEKDLNTKTYGEFSKLSNASETRIRLNSLRSVKRVIDKDKAPLIVLKPLVESQNLPKLLSYFPESKALWMYRHYKDVACSNILHWGPRNGINDLRPIVRNEPDNWRSENVSVARDIVKEFFSEEMNAYDAAALFWFVRNSFFFELDLANNSNVKLCKYNKLVTSPSKDVKEIYEFLGRSFPGNRIVSSIFSSSVNKGRDVKLSPEVDQLCMELLKKLDDVYERNCTC